MNIIFDLGGVLVDFNPRKVLTNNMKLSLDEADIIAKNTVETNLWGELDLGILPREEVFAKMLRSVPDCYKNTTKDFLENHVLETVTSFGYSRKWVQNLKQAGNKIFLLTNYPEWMFEYHYANVFTFTEFVDGKIVSGKVKQVKPNAEIYKTLLNKYALKPEECVFIDDRAENIEGAQKLGIEGIVFTTQQEVETKLSKIIKNSNLNK